MLLPPIGGLKGKRDSKMKSQTFKTAANASLQKPSVAAHGSATVHGAMSNGSTTQGSHTTMGALVSSKGFQSSKAGAAPGAMSSTSPHGWTSSKDKDHMRSDSSGSAGVPVTEKMNSTWAPNHSHQ